MGADGCCLVLKISHIELLCYVWCAVLLLSLLLLLLQDGHRCVVKVFGLARHKRSGDNQGTEQRGINNRSRSKQQQLCEP